MFANALYQGILLGITLAIFSMGPAFFALIETGIRHGFKAAALLAFGIFFSDVFCVLLVYFGAAKTLFANEQSKFWVAEIGGLLLMSFGLFTLFQKKKPIKVDGDLIAGVVEKANPFVVISKGFLFNILNPSVLILWLTWVGVVSSNKDYTSIDVLTFFAATLGIVLSTDLLKGYAAGKIRRILTADVQQKIHYIAGIALTIFGLWFVVKEFI